MVFALLFKISRLTISITMLKLSSNLIGNLFLITIPVHLIMIQETMAVLLINSQ